MAAPTEEQKKAWPAPNYEDPENLHSLVIGMTVPVLVLAVTCTLSILQITTPASRELILLGLLPSNRPCSRYQIIHQLSLVYPSLSYRTNTDCLATQF